MEDTKLTPVPREIQEAVTAFLAKHAQAEEFAALSTFRPTTVATTDGGVGYLQSPYIGNVLSPEVPCGANEEASYMTWTNDIFYSEDDVVAVGGATKRADTAGKWTRIDLDVHGKEALIDPREARAASQTGINIVAEKSRLPEEQVRVRREYLTGQFFQSTSSYASSSHYTTLSGTTQWSHASSTPIPVIVAAIEFIRGKIGKRPTHMWLSPNAFRALRFHASITDLIKYSGTQTNPGPASIATIAALFNINVVVGEAVVKTTVNGAISDVWGDSAGLAYVGGVGVYDPKFCMTAVSQDYPKVFPFRNDNAGGEGSDGIRFLDAYKLVTALTSAGYWWNDVTSY